MVVRTCLVDPTHAADHDYQGHEDNQRPEHETSHFCGQTGKQVLFCRLAARMPLRTAGA